MADRKIIEFSCVFFCIGAAIYQANWFAAAGWLCCLAGTFTLLLAEKKDRLRLKQIGWLEEGLKVERSRNG